MDRASWVFYIWMMEHSHIKTWVTLRDFYMSTIDALQRRGKVSKKTGLYKP